MCANLGGEYTGQFRPQTTWHDTVCDNKMLRFHFYKTLYVLSILSVVQKGYLLKQTLILHYCSKNGSTVNTDNWYYQSQRVGHQGRVVICTHTSAAGAPL